MMTLGEVTGFWRLRCDNPECEDMCIIGGPLEGKTHALRHFDFCGKGTRVDIYDWDNHSTILDSVFRLSSS